VPLPANPAVTTKMSDFRFDDPDQYVNGTPHAALASLRRDAPFAWHPTFRDSRDGFWLATRHRDVVSISRNPRLFATHAPLLADPIPRPLWRKYPALAMIADNLMTFDSARHSVFRPLATALFSAGRIAQVEARIREICVQVIEGASQRPRFDFAQEVALRIAAEAILCLFVGIPREDIDKVVSCVLTINAMDDPVFRPHNDSLLDAAEELCVYAIARQRSLQIASGEGVLEDLIRSARVEGVTAEQLFLVYWFPLVAGAFDTTASTIAGGVKAFLQFPSQLAALRADRKLIPLAVEEMIRWVSPVVYFRRTATEDTDFNGQRILKDHKVILCYASANRDEEVFPRGDQFEVARTPNNHLSFGYGPHFCLGARLAAAVVRIFLEEFLERLTDIRLEGAVTHTRSAWMNRIRVMPVSYPHSPS